MKCLQAFKYELILTGAQRRAAGQFDGCRRFVFNKGLDASVQHYKDTGKTLGYNAMASLLVQWKHDPQYVWLKDAPSQVLQQALKDLDQSYRNFFKGTAKFPTFKKKGRDSGFRFPQGFKVENHTDRFFLPKLGWVRFRNSRAVLGLPKNITLGSKGGKWFASVQTEREVMPPVHPSISSIGIDLGVKRFATLSDGSFIEPLNAFKKQQDRLVRYQRRMSRKKKFSKNWTKAKARVQQQHIRIGNARRDFLHKSTTILSKNHALIVVEDLKVKNMSSSTSGTAVKPGRNVKQKAGLNRSILDQGWGNFRTFLEYKQDWSGGIVVAVPPHYTSQTCPACSHVSKENRKTQASFVCVECGFSGHADHVAAINILERGHRLLACPANDAVRSSATGTHRSDLTQACA